MRNPANAVRNRKKKFLIKVAEGMDPQAACKLVWPKIKGVTEHVAKVMADPVFAEGYRYLMAHKYSKERLLQQCMEISGDSELRTSERVNALKLASQLAGHIQTVEKAPKAKSKADDGLNSKLAVLARKAGEHGHQGQATH